jgi:hypothetical protein
VKMGGCDAMYPTQGLSTIGYRADASFYRIAV